MLISTNAIILKTIPYGDSSIISRIFTEDHGKITVIAKGVWRPRNTAGYLLEPMNHIQLQYYHKNSRDIQILKDAELNISVVITGKTQCLLNPRPPYNWVSANSGMESPIISFLMVK